MMKTKKFLVGLLSLMFMLVCPMALTGCNKECKKHTWGEWIETTAATCTQDGLKTRTCSKCPKTDNVPKDSGCMQESAITVGCLTEECLSLANRINSLMF